MSNPSAVGRIGHLAVVRSNGLLLVAVEVVAERAVYGRSEYQVMPVAGFGFSWVASSSITFQESGT